MSGIERIAKERQRQIEREGFSAGHDDSYPGSELTDAAICYADYASRIIEGVDLPCALTGPIYRHWPWPPNWWKPSDDPIRNLEKAGALIAAEIDRLERAQERATHN